MFRPSSSHNTQNVVRSFDPEENHHHFTLEVEDRRRPINTPTRPESSFFSSSSLHSSSSQSSLFQNATREKQSDTLEDLNATIPEIEDISSYMDFGDPVNPLQLLKYENEQLRLKVQSLESQLKSFQTQNEYLSQQLTQCMNHQKMIHATQISQLKIKHHQALADLYHQQNTNFQRVKIELQKEYKIRFEQAMKDLNRTVEDTKDLIQQNAELDREIERKSKIGRLYISPIASETINPAYPEVELQLPLPLLASTSRPVPERISSRSPPERRDDRKYSTFVYIPFWLQKRLKIIGSKYNFKLFTKESEFIKCVSKHKPTKAVCFTLRKTPRLRFIGIEERRATNREVYEFILSHSSDNFQRGGD